MPLPETEHSYLVAPRSFSHWNAGVGFVMVPLGDVCPGGEITNPMPLLQGPVAPLALARTLHMRSTAAGSAFMRWREAPRLPLKKRHTLPPRRI
jgi:hypothetical protein